YLYPQEAQEWLAAFEKCSPRAWILTDGETGKFILFEPGGRPRAPKHAPASGRRSNNNNKTRPRPAPGSTLAAPVSAAELGVLEAFERQLADGRITAEFFQVVLLVHTLSAQETDGIAREASAGKRRKKIPGPDATWKQHQQQHQQPQQPGQIVPKKPIRLPQFKRVVRQDQQEQQQQQPERDPDARRWYHPILFVLGLYCVFTLVPPLVCIRFAWKPLLILCIFSSGVVMLADL
ncbi:unnamed protein product, partial [Mycena citricolor]